MATKRLDATARLIAELEWKVVGFPSRMIAHAVALTNFESTRRYSVAFQHERLKTSAESILGGCGALREASKNQQVGKLDLLTKRRGRSAALIERPGIVMQGLGKVWQCSRRVGPRTRGHVLQIGFRMVKVWPRRSG
jgi:hypothetical protein